MNPKLLIDAIVQQTTVLIAQLSTTGGIRAPLAKVADQVFLDLAREIERQGVPRKVAADMFGMMLRTYQIKVRRLTESVSEDGTTLWEEVLALVEDQGGCERRAITEHFPADDPMSIGAVLKDLCDTGLLYRTGSVAAGCFRAVPLEERKAILKAQDEEAFSLLARIAIYYGAESEALIARRLGAPIEDVRRAVQRLTDDEIVQTDESGRLRITGVAIPTGSRVGWEAAVFHHFQAVVTALTRKLASGKAHSASDDVIGGGTVSFEISAQHPMRNKVLGLLKQVRGEVDILWNQVGEYDRTYGSPDDPKDVVTFYFGQSIKEGA